MTQAEVRLGHNTEAGMGTGPENATSPEIGMGSEGETSFLNPGGNAASSAMADVAQKRANLLHGQGEIKVGRREPAPPYDPWPKRKLYIRGLLLGALVVVFVAIVIFVAAQGIQIEA